MVAPVRRGDIYQAGAHLEFRGDSRHAAEDILSWFRGPSPDFGPVGSVFADSMRWVTSAFISMVATLAEAAARGTGTVGTMRRNNFLVT